eukprot:g42732.t1
MEIRRARRGHEIALANRIKENPKGFYKYIKDKRVTKDRIGPLKDQQGSLCVETEEMGETPNEYFASVFIVEKDMNDRERGEINSDIMKNVLTTEEEVLDILKCMKVGKSPGPDQMYPRTLREAREEIVGPIAEIIVSSIATGEVPEDWRLANVVPLLTKDGGIVSKFADDTKIRDIVDSEEGYLRVQWDLDEMGQWAEEWQMEFNLDK